MSSTNLESLAAREDVEIVGRRLDALENKKAPALDLSGYVERPELDYVSKRTDAVIAEMGVMADKIAALSLQADPTAAPSINDPALAEFKKSVLDAVAQMLAGGDKQPPPDIGWTNCRNAAGTAEITNVQARMIAGTIELKGWMGFGSTSSSFNLLQLPASFPIPEITASYPVAAKLTGVNAVYGYVNVSHTSRVLNVTPSSNMNEVTLSGVRFRAAY